MLKHCEDLNDVLKVGQAAKVQRFRPKHEKNFDELDGFFAKNFRVQGLETKSEQLVTFAQPETHSRFHVQNLTIFPFNTFVLQIKEFFFIQLVNELFIFTVIELPQIR